MRKLFSWKFRKIVSNTIVFLLLLGSNFSWIQAVVRVSDQQFKAVRSVRDDAPPEDGNEGGTVITSSCCEDIDLLRQCCCTVKERVFIIDSLVREILQYLPCDCDGGSGGSCDLTTVESKIDDLHLTMESKLDELDDKVDIVQMTVEDIEITVNNIKNCCDAAQIKLDTILSFLPCDCDGGSGGSCDLTTVESKIDDLHLTMESKLDVLDDKVDTVDVKIEDLTDIVETNFEQVDQSLVTIEGKVDNVAACCATANTKLDDIKTELAYSAECGITSGRTLRQAIDWIACNLSDSCDLTTVESKIDDLHLTMESKLDLIIDDIRVSDLCGRTSGLSIKQAIDLIACEVAGESTGGGGPEDEEEAGGEEGTCGVTNGMSLRKAVDYIACLLGECPCDLSGIESKLERIIDEFDPCPGDCGIFSDHSLKCMISLLYTKAAWIHCIVTEIERILCEHHRFVVTKLEHIETLIESCCDSCDPCDLTTIESKIDELDDKVDKIINDITESTKCPQLYSYTIREVTDLMACDILTKGECEETSDKTLRQAVDYIACNLSDSCDLTTVESKIDDLHLTMESKLDLIIDDIRVSDLCGRTSHLSIKQAIDLIACEVAGESTGGGEEPEGEEETCGVTNGMSLRKAVDYIACNLSDSCDLTTIESKIDDLHLTMESKLDVLDDKVDTVDVKIEDLTDIVEESFEEVDQFLVTIESKIDDLHLTMESKLDVLDDKVDTVDVKIEDLTDIVETNFEEVDQFLVTIESKIDDLHLTMESKLDELDDKVDKIINDITESTKCPQLYSYTIREVADLMACDILTKGECEETSDKTLRQAVDYIACNLSDSCDLTTVESKIDDLHLTMESKLDLIIDDIRVSDLCELTSGLSIKQAVDFIACQVANSNSGCPECCCPPDYSLRELVCCIYSNMGQIRMLLTAISCYLINVIKPGHTTIIEKIESCCEFTNTNLATIESKIDDLHLTMESKLDVLDDKVDTVDSKIGDLHSDLGYMEDIIDVDACSDLDVNDTNLTAIQWLKVIYEKVK